MKLFEELYNGNTNVLKAFADSKNKWRELLADFEWNDNSTKKLAGLISEYQFEFEGFSNDRYAGQEVLVISAFEFFKNEFEDDKMEILINAFGSCFCSGEIDTNFSNLVDYYKS